MAELVLFSASSIEKTTHPQEKSDGGSRARLDTPSRSQHPAPHFLDPA